MRLLLSIVLLSVVAHAQQSFQVATIKPSAPDTAKGTQIRGNRFATTGTTPLDLFVYAYNIHGSQLICGPDWLRTSKFDVMAVPEGDQRPTSPEMKAMVQLLLTDRFHLVLHHETRELSVYAIVRANKEPVLKVSEGNAMNIPTGGFTPPGSLFVYNATLTNFAAFLQRFSTGDIDRPVVDQTAIPGHFDFELHYTPGNAPPDATAKPGIFTAMQEQLGLKLKLTKAPVDVLIIDSASLPTPD
jgi:uncharacterized protein (TIGR03435 family)